MPVSTANGTEPALSVVAGRPTDQELAALVAVLATLPQASPQAPARARRSAWSAPATLLRTGLAPGAGAWRRSALPR